MTQPNRIALISMVLLVAILPSFAQRLHTLQQITNDGDCENTAKIPADALKAVLESKVAKEALLDEPPVQDPGKLFGGSQFKLGHAGQIALLICGTGQMTGADNAWYWIVATPYTHPRVVLFEGTDALWLLPQSHYGYHDIESGWAVAAQSHEKTFRFNGSKHILASERCYMPSPDNNGANKRVPCY